MSRLTEILLRKLTTGGYATIENFPVSDWVNMVSEGEAEYINKPKKNKQLRTEYHTQKNNFDADILVSVLNKEYPAYAYTSRCGCILTSELNGFYSAEPEVLNPEAFFRKYLT